jgi:hypothetical protein
MVVQQLASFTSTVESLFCKMIAARGFVALERGVGEEDRTGGSDTEEISASGTYFRRIYVPVGGKVIDYAYQPLKTSQCHHPLCRICCAWGKRGQEESGIHRVLSLRGTELFDRDL